MGKSSNKAGIEVAAPTESISNGKINKKGKRVADSVLEKNANNKKQKKEIVELVTKQKEVTKAKKVENVPQLNKMPSSSEETSSSDEEKVPEKAAAISKKPLKHASFSASLKIANHKSSSEESSSDDESDSSADKKNEVPKKTSALAKTSTKSASYAGDLKSAGSDSSSDESSSDDDSDSSSDKKNIPVMPSKGPILSVSKNNKVVNLKKTEKYSDSSDSDSSSDEEVAANAKAKAKVAAKAVLAQPSESLSDSEFEEDKALVPKIGASSKRSLASEKKSITQKSSKKLSATDSSEDSSDDSDEEPERKKMKSAVILGAGNVSAKVAKEDSSSDDEEKFSENVNEEQPKIPRQRKDAGLTAGRNTAAEASDDDGEDESEEKKTKKISLQKDNVPSSAGKKDAKVTNSESSSESEDESSEEESEERPSSTPQKAIDLKNKDTPKGDTSTKQSLSTSEKQSKTPTDNQAQASESNILFVGNLSFKATEDDLYEFFKEAGNIHEVRLAKDADERLKGFGLVEFTTAEAAQKALELGDMELLGRAVKLEFARPKGAYTQNTGKERSSYQKGEQEAQDQTVFVKGFNTQLDLDQAKSAIEAHFAACGEITRLSVPTDYETGGIKGSAYIDFKDQKGCNSALKLNGLELGGYALTVDVAKPRNDGGDGGGFRGGRGRSEGRDRSGRRSGRGWDGGRGRSGRRGRGGAWGGRFGNK